MSDGFEPAIKDVYSTQYAASSNSEPYWIPALKCYIFTDDVDVNSGSGEDLCGTDRALGWTVYGYHADSAYYSLADGSIEYETYEASTDIVVICPKVLTGESEKVDVLSKVPYTEPSTATELSSILPISSTLFHELFHMTTYWEGEDVGEDAVPNTDYVEDFTYDLFEALDLAMGVLKRDSSSNAEGDGDSGSGSDADSESEDDGDSASYSDAEDYGDSGSDSGSTSSDSDSEYYPSKEAARNAESYVFFAVAWWNYAKSWTEGDSAVFYTGCAESWEWLGPLTSCSDSTTST
ncbi:hypothetical protein N7488_003411 [Penicillium malachiteum]|nr:hypothetical protein N7488_003411 [Penicillium malachiteum]